MRSARCIAAKRLPGSARPVPARSRAVPWSTEVRTIGNPSVTLTACPKPTVFEHGQALIVIHGDDRVDVLQRLLGESGVSGQWALNKMAAASEICNNGRDDVNFLPTEVTGLASMGVQATDADAWLGNAKVFT